MRRLLALEGRREIRCGEATVYLEPTGDISVGSHVVVRVDWNASSDVVAWSGRDWCCFIGLRGLQLAILRPPDQAMIAGDLARLDFEGGYDPGGFHRVEMHELADDEILIVHEFGLARVSSLGIVWQQCHRDLTARVAQIDHDTVWFESESDYFGYSVEDGRFVHPSET